MASLLLQADQILRGRSPDVGAGADRKVQQFLTATLVAGMAYGAVMGTFGGFGGDRVWQIIFSALKVPLLLTVTFAIGLPSFFVLNSLFGLRDDFGEALRALLAAQAGLTVILASLAPYTALWYISFSDYQSAILFNAFLFAVASFSAQWLLRRHYIRLIARNRRHRLLLRTWLVVYAFVGIQMGWVLRPFVGAPEMPVQFFREEAWGNAYVVVARMIWDVITR